MGDLTPRPPCRTHNRLTVDLTLDTRRIENAHSANVTIRCSACGGVVVHTDDVPVTVTYRRSSDGRGL